MDNTLVYNRIPEGFYRTLFELLKLHQDIIPVLKDELNSIISEDAAALDECLKSLQALTLRIRATESQSEKILKENGLSADILSDSIRQMPEAEQSRYNSLKAQFSDNLREITFYRDKCGVMLKTRLSRLDRQPRAAGPQSFEITV